MKRNSALSFIRVAAMLSIIIGHWCTWKGINTFQLGGLGVEIFLLLSGYLYGTKDIPDKISWGRYRMLRLMPPLWITVALHQIILVFIGEPLRGKSILLYLFDLQGLNRVLINAKLPTFLGMGQTWFITVIAICYLLMSLIKNTTVEKIIDRHFPICLMISIGIQMLLAYLGIQIAYILQFFIGYFLVRNSYWNDDCKQNSRNRNIIILISSTILMVFFMLLRVILHKTIDGTIFYDRIISRWSFNSLAIWIVVCILQFSANRPLLFERITNTKLWVLLDKTSYSLFLAHYMFVKGEISTDIWIHGSALQSICFVLFTIIVGIFIYNVTKLFNTSIQNCIRRKPKQ